MDSRVTGRAFEYLQKIGRGSKRSAANSLAALSGLGEPHWERKESFVHVSTILIGGESWMQFSFNIPWSDGDSIMRFLAAARKRFKLDD